MRLLRWILVHFPLVRGIPLQPHHLHEQTGDDNEEFVKNYDENNVDFNDAMWKNRWKSKFKTPQCHIRLSACCESKRTVGARLGQVQIKWCYFQCCRFLTILRLHLPKKWVSRVVWKISKLSSDLVELSFRQRYMMIMMVEAKLLRDYSPLCVWRVPNLV